MSVIVKGDSPFDAFIVSGIKGCHTEHIKFYNISFNCKTIEDADGRVFTRCEERKTGKWINRSLNILYPEWERYTCSVCGKHSDNYDFCPNCGADMRGDSNDR